MYFCGLIQHNIHLRRSWLANSSQPLELVFCLKIQTRHIAHRSRLLEVSMRICVISAVNILSKLASSVCYFAVTPKHHMAERCILAIIRFWVDSHMKKLEIRSVEHGICPIAEFTSPLLSCAAILAIRP